MSESMIALSCFIIVQVINISALGFDYVLIKAGLPSITSVCQAFKWIGWGLVLFQVSSPLTLAFHFFS